MGACIARCLPLFPDPSYQPVRSRYLTREETIQLEFIDTNEAQPRSPFSVAASLRALLTRLRSKPSEDEVELAFQQEDTEAMDRDSTAPAAPRSSRHVTIGISGRRWGIRGVPGSMASLSEPDSPPTTSIDLEWEPEAGLVRSSRDSECGEEEASQTADSTSWVPRSACSTPNSLEWDFRASTLSLRGPSEEETWQHTDLETEQLIHEIEQLTARALADTGHGLQAAPR